MFSAALFLMMKNKNKARSPQLMPVILLFWEAEIRRMVV
jgi:hypothetical protein